MKRYLLIIICIIFSFSLYGCKNSNTNESQNTDNILVFYGDENNVKIIAEEREITYSNDYEKYKLALEELIKGPIDNNLTTNISKNTEVISTVVDNNDIVVNLSSDFKTFSGSLAEIIGVGSVVNTLTQFDNIDRVKILIEGEEFIGPSGEPRGFMEEFPLDPSA